MPTDPNTTYDRYTGPRDRSLRVGDKERDAVGEVLRERHVEGRLDAAEFQARLEQSMAAKTYADLDTLVADFPREGEERRRDGQPWRGRLLPIPFRLPLLFLPLALIGAIFVVGHLFWLAVPLLLLFVVVRRFVWRRWGGGYWRGPCAGFGPRRAMRF
jgi:Domain of unknown function (DUF1707)